MSTENTEANVADKLAQALRDIAEHRMSMCGADDFHHLKKIARTALAVHELEMAKAAGSVDCIGLALELEFQSKLVESLATERAMRAAAHGLRLLAGGVAPVAPVAGLIFTDEMRADLIRDTAEVFDRNGPFTPQIVRDVIEYVDSALQVLIGKAHGKAKAAPAEPVAAPPAPAGYMNAGQLFELRQGRLPWAYLYREKGVGSSVPVFTGEAPAAAPASASEAPVAAPLTDELTGKLMRIHAALGKMGKKYGEIGSRDVDVARWNADLYEAIAAVGGVLADQPLEQLARIKLEGGQE